MGKRIKITESLSTYVEKLNFEYNAMQNILRYLSSQESVNQEYLDKYFEEAKQKNMELELAKKEISQAYMPKDICVCRYSFDFDNCEIVYSGGECHG